MKPVDEIMVNLNIYKLLCEDAEIKNLSDSFKTKSFGCDFDVFNLSDNGNIYINKVKSVIIENEEDFYIEEKQIPFEWSGLLVFYTDHFFSNNLNKRFAWSVLVENGHFDINKRQFLFEFALKM